MVMDPKEDGTVLICTGNRPQIFALSGHSQFVKYSSMRSSSTIY